MSLSRERGPLLFEVAGSAGGGGSCLRAAGHDAGDAHASKPLRDHVHQRGVDRKAGDDGEQAAALDVALIDGDEEEVLAVEDQAADLIAVQIGGPGWKTERPRRLAGDALRCWAGAAVGWLGCCAAVGVRRRGRRRE